MVKQDLKRKMEVTHTDYSLFLKFTEAYAPCGYMGIDPCDPLMLELEEQMEKNNQFFFLADMMRLTILFTSKGSFRMMGIKSEELDPGHFFETIHQDDLKRYSLGRTSVISLYVAKKGIAILSSNARVRNPQGEFSDLLFQIYLFYSTIPCNSVFLLRVHTDITLFKKRKQDYHRYIGSDLSNFRYPDEELLKIGVPFTDREIEIIKLIHSGMKSEQIGEKIFLSVHTVNTHRRNIMAKTDKATISDLIYDLMNQGIL
jgi:hypothetical protein